MIWSYQCLPLFPILELMKTAMEYGPGMMVQSGTTSIQTTMVLVAMRNRTSPLLTMMVGGTTGTMVNLSWELCADLLVATQVVMILALKISTVMVQLGVVCRSTGGYSGGDDTC